MLVPFDERSDDLPSHFSSAWNWWAVYCAPQSCRSPRPRAIRGAYAAMWVRTPCRTGSRAAQRSPFFATCHPTTSVTQ